MAGRELIAHAWRYGLVGLANTGVGLVVILVVEFGFKAPPVVANACGRDIYWPWPWPMASIWLSCSLWDFCFPRPP